MRVARTLDYAIVVATLGYTAFLDPYGIARDRRRGASIAREGARERSRDRLGCDRSEA